MPTVIHPPVTEETLMNFMVESCQLSKLPLEYRDVTATMMRKSYHPYAGGHLSALKYGVKLAETHSFPVRTVFDFSNELQSDKNLYWVRDINEKLMKPIAKAPQMRPDLPEINYPLQECGVYRLHPKNVLLVREGDKPLVRPIPKAAATKRLMHLWHKDLCEFHQSYAKKIDQPHTLKPADITILANKANELHLQFMCIKPFLRGNGRSARIIQNMLRLRWGLAWKTTTGRQSVDYVKQIMEYEDSPKWQNLLKANDAL